MEDQGKRILLFVVLAGVIFFAWQYMFPPEKSPPKPAAIPGEAGVPPTATSPVGKPKEGTPAPVEVAVTEQPIVLESNAVKVTFSNVGGVLKEWEVLYDPAKGRVMHEHLVHGELPGKSLGAVNFVASTHVLPIAGEWKGEKISDRKVRYRYTGDGLDVTKEYELFPDDYVVKLSVEVGLAPGSTVPAATERLAVSVFGHAPVESQSRRARVPTGAACHINGSVSSLRSRDLVRGPRERQGTIRFAGLAHRYDLVAISPKDGRTESLACNAYKLDGVKDGVQVDLVYPEATLKPGDPPVRREMTVYVGPRYLEKLEHADKIAGHETGFRDVLDFGWFSFLAKPMLWLLSWLYGFVGNWGVAIILLTVIVKLATLYWTTKSMRSMRSMAALKPEIEAIQKKYPDDKTKQQQAQMDLFKQHGVSPLAGCLPMLLQMPIWFALYKMLSVAGELHGAIFIPGWLDDLTARDPVFVLPVALTSLMFLQSKIQPTAGGDPMQQKVLQYGLPLMFGFMGLYFPSGLGVYMLTNSALSIAHSMYMKRTDKKAPPKAVAKTDKSDEKSDAKSDAKGDAKVSKNSDEAEAEAEDDGEEPSGDDLEAEAAPAKGAAANKGSGGGQAQGQKRNKQRRGKRR
ncbi:MAG TPA: membrane protein insertase YidC [Kofleriaceae bacterium]|nr:membrane protein insertase YidC [Kofleriaceae bacterium]